MNRPTEFFRYWVPVLVWMAVIFLFSNRQRITVSPEYLLNFLFFKSLHVIEYAVLFVLARRACRGASGNTFRIPAGLAALGIVILYAITDEFHQTFVPTREGRLRDVIIDGAGAAFAWLILAYLLPKAPKQLRKLAAALEVA